MAPHHTTTLETNLGRFRMEREDLLALLRAQKAADPEAGHMVADQALLEYIDDAEIRQAFEAITKWYA